MIGDRMQWLQATPYGDAIPVITDARIARGDVVLTHGRAIVHPYMVLELTHRRDPWAWLAAILAKITERAEDRATAKIIGLEMDQADDVHDQRAAALDAELERLRRLRHAGDWDGWRAGMDALNADTRGRMDAAVKRMDAAVKRIDAAQVVRGTIAP